MTYMFQLEGESYNYKSELILYNQEYLNYICIIRKFFIYSLIVSLLLKDIKSLFNVLMPFFNINETPSIVS